MPRLHACFCVALLVVSACARTTLVESSEPLDIRARPPAPPPPELAAVEQPPPPPPRVVLEGELVRLDEVLGFDAADQLAPDNADILDALAIWLREQPSGVLTIEVHVVGKGSRKQLTTRSKALAQRLADALVTRGVAPERVRASGLGKSPDEQVHVVLRLIHEEAKP
jgi:outer membrane protein OmpA-like peptidoglycan-associated protein